MEVKDKVNKIINKYSGVDKPLILILHDIQDEFGYLNYDDVLFLSEKMNISLNEIYSVASFYKDFKMNPIGKYHISVCLGTVCYIEGAEKIVSEIEKILHIKNGEVTKDFKFSLDTSRCLGCCSMAPVMAINGKVYGNLKVEDVKKILDGCE